MYFHIIYKLNPSH